MKIAQYKLYGTTHIHECEDYLEDDAAWIRLTEPLEVEFIDLSTAVTTPLQIDFINKSIKKLRDEMAEKVARLEDEKAKLLALTHQAA